MRMFKTFVARSFSTTSNDSQPTRNNSPSTQPATLATVRTQNWQSTTPHQITGECEIDNHITKFLADTGSNKTIVHKSLIDIHNNEHGHIRHFKSQVLTAEGQRANIIGIKKCKITVGNWVFLADVLISSNLITTCIIGLDILSIFPPTKETSLISKPRTNR